MTENAGKQLTIKPNQAIIAVGNQIDAIVNECLPVAAMESQNFVQALTLANGIKALRQIILHDPHIKETITSMQNTHLGFMTDRTDLAIWKSKQGQGKELKPYRYEDIAEVCIEGMMKGYRITNNEFNIIASRFYPAKNGKFRRIQECEGVTDFQFTTTSPLYEQGQGGIQYAKVQAFASWKKDGQLATLGSSGDTEDKLIFKIRVNKMMGEDAIVGKALSKLFSRVLMRLEGKILPESTDVSDDIVDAEIESTSDLSDAIKGKVEEKEERATTDETETKSGIHDLSDFTPGPELELKGTPETIKSETIPPTDFWKGWRELWINLRGPGFATWFYKNRGRFEAASIELKEEARAKWLKLYPETPWPLDNSEREEDKSGTSDEGDERKLIIEKIREDHLIDHIARAKAALRISKMPLEGLSLDLLLVVQEKCEALINKGEDLE